MPRKKKLIETKGKTAEPTTKPSIETTGHFESPKPTTMEQLFNKVKVSRYNTWDEKVYAESLKEMTRADLENHARNLNVLLVEDTNRLKDKLVQVFREYVRYYQSGVAVPKPPAQVTLSEASKKIMAEGR